MNTFRNKMILYFSSQHVFLANQPQNVVFLSSLKSGNPDFLPSLFFIFIIYHSLKASWLSVTSLQQQIRACPPNSTLICPFPAPAWARLRHRFEPRTRECPHSARVQSKSSFWILLLSSFSNPDSLFRPERRLNPDALASIP